MYAKNIRPSAKRDGRTTLKLAIEARADNMPPKRADFFN